MSALPVVDRVVKNARSVVDRLVDLHRYRRFEQWPGARRGVFQSFAEARAAAPTNKLGFDHAEFGNFYDFRIGKAFPSDYPLMFWLTRLLPVAPSVFDWGGHVGVSYYTYTKYLNFDERSRWRVCEVPEVAKAGTKLADSRGETRLSFTTDPLEASDFDVLLANGSLQFIEASLVDSLRALRQRPAHLLLNKVPLYGGEPFVTLENTIHSYNPYKIGNRDAFIASLTDFGYTLVDSWETPDMSCHIPLHRDRAIDAYSGFYFRAT